MFDLCQILYTLSLSSLNIGYLNHLNYSIEGNDDGDGVMVGLMSIIMRMMIVIMKRMILTDERYRNSCNLSSSIWGMASPIVIVSMLITIYYDVSIGTWILEK